MKIETKEIQKTHPHSTPEYVEWMANVWRLNYERNKNY